MKTYDRNRNAIATGSMVMIAGNGTTGVIKAIHGEGKTAEQLRRADCVEIDGCEGRFCPFRSDPSRLPLIPAARSSVAGHLRRPALFPDNKAASESSTEYSSRRSPV